MENLKADSDYVYSDDHQYYGTSEDYYDVDKNPTATSVYDSLNETMKEKTDSYYGYSDISSTDTSTYYYEYNYYDEEYYYDYDNYNDEDYYNYDYDNHNEKTVYDSTSEKAVYDNPSEKPLYGNRTEFAVYDFETVILGYLSPAVVILSVLANIFVIFYFLRNTTRAKTTSLLFILIAVSDTLTGSFLVPSSVYVYILQNVALPLEWLTGFLYLSRVWQTMSVWQTVLLASQKFTNLLQPMCYRRFCTFRKILVAIVAISVTAFVFHTFLLTNNKLVHKLCRWGTDQACTGSVVYTWLSLALIHLIPCVILICTTSKTLSTLKTVQHINDCVPNIQGKPYHGTPGGQLKACTPATPVHRSAKDRVMTVTVAFIVAVSLIPELLYCIFSLAAVIKTHCDTPFDNFDGRVFYAVYELVLVISFHCKFWVYFIMLRDFRSLLVRLIKCSMCSFGTSVKVTTKAPPNCTTYVATANSKLNANIYNVLDDVHIRAPDKVLY